MGLAGIAALSPAATALSSYQEAADVADRLLVCLDAAVSVVKCRFVLCKCQMFLRRS